MIPKPLDALRILRSKCTRQCRAGVAAYPFVHDLDAFFLRDLTALDQTLQFKIRLVDELGARGFVYRKKRQVLQLGERSRLLSESGTCLDHLVHCLDHLVRHVDPTRGIGISHQPAPLSIPPASAVPRISHSIALPLSRRG